MTAKLTPGWVPPWQDMPTLCKHICCSDVTVTKWVAEGILPAPRKRGGKLMWKWSEVDERLTVGAQPQGTTSTPEDEIARNVRLAIENHANH